MAKEKTIEQLTKEIKRLRASNSFLSKQVKQLKQAANPEHASGIDAFVVAHKEGVRVFTEKNPEKIYRLLIEKMHKGALALNVAGTILYCNAYFAKMVCSPLQKVMGAGILNFIPPQSTGEFQALMARGWMGYSQAEIMIRTITGDDMSVLVSVNPLMLEGKLILSTLVSDITHRDQSVVRTTLVNSILEVIDNMPAAVADQTTHYSSYISDKLHHSYEYLAALFKETKGVSIQKYLILNKIEKVKEELIKGVLNLTQISYKHNYSSVAHLSNQFKVITGKSPSRFILENRPGSGQRHPVSVKPGA